MVPDPGRDLSSTRELLVELSATNQRIDFYCWDLYARVSQWYTGSGADDNANADPGVSFTLPAAVNGFAAARSAASDNTIGVAIEVGVPMNTAFSRNTEMVPKIFDDLKVGEFTLQAINQ